MTADKLIEAMARALCKGRGGNPDAQYQEYGQTSWAFAEWTLFRDEVRTIVAAIDAAGWRAVPKEPTEVMANQILESMSEQTHASAIEAWRVALAAAPKVSP